ncbi:MAG: thermonuclease family protein [Alphaproteobacteria bacterium]|nr:thermonuclease family protein [Alphaproteobacteria bacterium]
MRRDSRLGRLGLAATLLIVLIVAARESGFGNLFAAREFAGPARVVDGDSLEIAERRVRLFGIDAPELAQLCGDRSRRDYACGERAREALETLVGDAVLQCVTEGQDRFRRVLARCRTPDGVDIGAALVRAGWAVAYHGRDGRSYRTAESDAQRRRVGLWAGRFDRPEDWRRDHPSR